MERARTILVQCKIKNMYIRKTNSRSCQIMGFEAFMLCINAPKWQRNIGAGRSQMGAMHEWKKREETEAESLTLQ